MELLGWVLSRGPSLGRFSTVLSFLHLSTLVCCMWKPPAKLKPSSHCLQPVRGKAHLLTCALWLLHLVTFGLLPAAHRPRLWLHCSTTQARLTQFIKLISANQKSSVLVQAHFLLSGRASVCDTIVLQDLSISSLLVFHNSLFINKCLKLSSCHYLPHYDKHTDRNHDVIYSTFPLRLFVLVFFLK